MNLVVGRSEYPSLAKHLDNDFPHIGYDTIIVSAFEKFTAYHPQEKLAGFNQKQFQFWLANGNEPKVTICKQFETPFPGLETGIKVSWHNAEGYERGDKFKIVGGALAGREVYQATTQLLGQLVMWAIWNRDRDKPSQWEWTAEKPAQEFLDYLYGPNEFFW